MSELAPSAQDNRSTLAITAWLLAALVAAMAVLGVLIYMGHDLRQAHSIMGYIASGLGVVAAVLAWRATADGSRGIFYHALSIPLLMVVQIALGEMAQTWVHMILGFLLLIAIVGLAMMARRPHPEAA